MTPDERRLKNIERFPLEWIHERAERLALQLRKGIERETQGYILTLLEMTLALDPFDGEIQKKVGDKTKKGFIDHVASQPYLPTPYPFEVKGPDDDDRDGGGGMFQSILSAVSIGSDVGMKPVGLDVHCSVVRYPPIKPVDHVSDYAWSPLTITWHERELLSKSLYEGTFKDAVLHLGAIQKNQDKFLHLGERVVRNDAHRNDIEELLRLARTYPETAHQVLVNGFRIPDRRSNDTVCLDGLAPLRGPTPDPAIAPVQTSSDANRKRGRIPIKEIAAVLSAAASDKPSSLIGVCTNEDGTLRWRGRAKNGHPGAILRSQNRDEIRPTKKGKINTVRLSAGDTVMYAERESHTLEIIMRLAYPTLLVQRYPNHKHPRSNGIPRVRKQA